MAVFDYDLIHVERTVIDPPELLSEDPHMYRVASYVMKQHQGIVGELRQRVHILADDAQFTFFDIAVSSPNDVLIPIGDHQTARQLPPKFWWRAVRFLSESNSTATTEKRKIADEFLRINSDIAEFGWVGEIDAAITELETCLDNSNKLILERQKESRQ